VHDLLDGLRVLFAWHRCRFGGENAGVTELTTDRLLLRQWRDDDLAALIPIYADPEVMRYIADGRVKTPDETADQLAYMRRHWAEHDFGLFAAELRETGEVIGWIGLAVPHFLPEVMPTVEIGWRLGRSFWGKGLATEGARAALRFGLVDRELKRLVSIRHLDNQASGRVMEKLGMTLDRVTTIPGIGRQAAVYAITRDQYDSAG
jgi:RimJ/RimL family protein N-acetyltransferase